MNRNAAKSWALASAIALAVAPNGPAAAATPRAAPPTNVSILNRAPQPIAALRFSTSADQNWGRDRLTTHPLAKGRSATLPLDPAAGWQYDIQATYEDGATEENLGVNLCRTRQLSFDGSTSAAVPKATADVAVTNHAALDIKEIYVSPSALLGWGENWLADEPLSRQDKRSVAYRSACAADIRIVFKNGNAEERHGFDVCATPSVTITPDWTTKDADDASVATAPDPTQPGTEIRNRSGASLSSLYFYPEGATEQGDDLMGSGTLDDRSEQRVSVGGGDKCIFTMRARFQGHDDDVIRHNVDLCSGGGRLVLSPSLLIDAAVQNAGPLPIVNLYVDAQGAARGIDQLGDGVIARGAKYSLSPPLEGVCRYQVTAIFRDGREASADGDLCKDNPVVLR